MTSHTDDSQRDALQIDDGRYSRMHLIAWWDQQKLASAKVLVVGAGALGNEVIKNLALLGVGHIYVIDLDAIEASNLTRSVLFRERDCGQPKAHVAARSARDINPDCRIIPWHGDVMVDLGLGVFRDMDVVIGCLDNREARLWVNRMCWRVNTPWIDGGIQEINGVVKMFVPNQGACYECAMTENDYRLINLRYSCPLLKREDILSGKVPTAPTISSIIAGMQTQQALKVLHEMPVEAGTAWVFNGLSNTMYQTRFPFKEDCLSHETFAEPVATGLSAGSATANDIFRFASSLVSNADEMRIVLDRDLVISLACHCGVHKSVWQSIYGLSMRDAICEACGQTMKAERIHAIEQNSPYAEKKLADFGIPVYDIVQIATNTEKAFLLLDGDAQRMMKGLE
jgi:molybdopterin-synthase adenylyltransferase